MKRIYNYKHGLYMFYPHAGYNHYSFYGFFCGMMRMVI
jgi:hypothetical protein